MNKRLGAFALSIWMLLWLPASSFAAHLGPARTYQELLDLARNAIGGDTILITGALSGTDEALTTGGELYLRGEDGASISSLSLQDASIVLSGLSLEDGLRVTGSSHIQLSYGVDVTGGVDFSGSGALLLDPGTHVEGRAGSAGVSVRHTGGDLYISLDGVVRGGDGLTGGTAVVIDPLSTSGALMVTGTLTGGAGESFGGNALNLHNLSGNAYVTVDGTLTGGSGNIGGNGLQLITAEDNVSAGLGGKITGGSGSSYGGDAMMLMNVGGSSMISLSGSLTGGNSSGVNSTPGQSLTLLGKTTAMRTNVGSCILQDGKQVLTSIQVTPLPEITSSIDDANPLATPAPGGVATSGEAQPAPTPAPTPEPDIDFVPGA